MGSIVPIASQAIGAFQTANRVIRLISPVASVISRGIDFFDDDDDDRNKQQLQQFTATQQLQERQAAEKIALEKQEILAKAQEAEKKRRDALKRAVARQRAQFGASGVSSNGGSAEAVLLGLFEETDSDRAQREKLDNIRTSALDQSLANQRSVNTLQRQQLQQRQKLKSEANPLDAAKGLFDVF